MNKSVGWHPFGKQESRQPQKYQGPAHSEFVIKQAVFKTYKITETHVTVWPLTMSE